MPLGNQTYLELPTATGNASYLFRTDPGGRLNFTVPALYNEIANCSSNLVRFTYGPCPYYYRYANKNFLHFQQSRTFSNPCPYNSDICTTNENFLKVDWQVLAPLTLSNGTSTLQTLVQAGNINIKRFSNKQPFYVTKCIKTLSPQ